jgi:hypothetical protein
MRHIKLFEGFDTEEYYKKISKQELVETPIVDISDRIIYRIKDLGLNIFKIKSPNIVTYNGIRRVDIGYIKVGGVIVSIVECEDEYFIVQFGENISTLVIDTFHKVKDDPENRLLWSDYNRFSSANDYKCDQWEGLVKFLKDSKILK